MTPAPTTSAGRKAQRTRPLASPRTPRRVSGPVGGRLAAPNRPRFERPADPEPRRRPVRSPGRSRRRVTHRRGAAVFSSAARFVRSLPDHQLLDRAIRGRGWIPLLGLMLVGIVAMQVEVLKLGAGMGRSIQRASALESRNQQLRASVASLGDDQRIERIASGMGMVMPAPDAIGFLSRGQGMNVQQAISNIHVPNAAGFLALLSSNGAVVTGDPATSGESGTSITGTPGANAPISGASGDTTSTTPSTATPGSSTTTPTTPAIATPGTTTPSTTPPGG